VVRRLDVARIVPPHGPHNVHSPADLRNFVSRTEMRDQYADIG
jgi:hypothetical protein